MMDTLMQRVDGFCRLHLLFGTLGVPFPSSGDLLFASGSLCWTETDDADLHVMLTITRRRGDRLALSLRQCALALELLPFVRHVCKHNWDTTGLLDFIVEPDAISEDVCLGIASTGFSSVNLRAHVELPALPAGRKLL